MVEAIHDVIPYRTRPNLDWRQGIWSGVTTGVGAGVASLLVPQMHSVAQSIVNTADKLHPSLVDFNAAAILNTINNADKYSSFPPLVASLCSIGINTAARMINPPRYPNEAESFVQRTRHAADRFGDAMVGIWPQAFLMLMAYQDVPITTPAGQALAIGSAIVSAAGLGRTALAGLDIVRTVRRGVQEVQESGVGRKLRAETRARSNRHEPAEIPGLSYEDGLRLCIERTVDQNIHAVALIQQIITEARKKGIELTGQMIQDYARDKFVISENSQALISAADDYIKRSADGAPIFMRKYYKPTPSLSERFRRLLGKPTKPSISLPDLPDFLNTTTQSLPSNTAIVDQINYSLVPENFANTHEAPVFGSPEWIAQEEALQQF